MHVCNKGFVQNCTIVSNATTPDNVEGGGVFVSNDSNGTNWFQNCIIYSNTTPSGSYANYCHIYGSGLGSYSNCCLTPALSGASINYSTNNITADPQFVGWTNSNYRLSRNSQCINAGVNRDWMTNAVDFDGHRRVDKFSGRVDIGCYEYLPRGVIFTIR